MKVHRIMDMNASIFILNQLMAIVVLKTTIYMINHYSLIAQLLRYTKMSIERLAKEG